MSDDKKKLTEKELKEVTGGLRAAQGRMPRTIDPDPDRTDHVSDEVLDDVVGGRRAARARMPEGSEPLQADQAPGFGDDDNSNVDHVTDPPTAL